MVGIDFHCYPQMIDKLFHHFKDIKKEILKKAIWYMESSPTTKNKIIGEKKKIKEKYIIIWEKIKNMVYEIRNYYYKHKVILM